MSSGPEARCKTKSTRRGNGQGVWPPSITISFIDGVRRIRFVNDCDSETTSLFDIFDFEVELEFVLETGRISRKSLNFNLGW